MNTIIIYSSKYGCTADCAKYINTGLSGDATLIDVNNTNLSAIALENYDTVIFGSSIYIGKISKKMRKLCDDNIDLLSKKRIGIFLCCAFSEEFEEYLIANFSPDLLKCAVTIKGFGAKARIDKMKFIDKTIMKAAIKGKHENMKISYDNMDSFVRELNM